MHLYRRSARPATLQVPVVFPQIDVTVDAEGRLDLRLDGEPYPADEVLRRGDLQRVVTQIALDVGSAVRVDVREADGATFADIITPPADKPSDAPAADASVPGPGVELSATTVSGEVVRSGFGPGESVGLVVVVARVVADENGTARFRLPPALLASHEVLLVNSPAVTATATVGVA